MPSIRNILHRSAPQSVSTEQRTELATRLANKKKPDPGQIRKLIDEVYKDRLSIDNADSAAMRDLGRVFARHHHLVGNLIRDRLLETGINRNTPVGLLGMVTGLSHPGALPREKALALDARVRLAVPERTEKELKETVGTDVRLRPEDFDEAFPDPTVEELANMAKGESDVARLALRRLFFMIVADHGKLKVEKGKFLAMFDVLDTMHKRSQEGRFGDKTYRKLDAEIRGILRSMNAPVGSEEKSETVLGKILEHYLENADTVNVDDEDDDSFNSSPMVSDNSVDGKDVSLTNSVQQPSPQLSELETQIMDTTISNLTKNNEVSLESASVEESSENTETETTNRVDSLVTEESETESGDEYERSFDEEVVSSFLSKLPRKKDYYELKEIYGDIVDDVQKERFIDFIGGILDYGRKQKYAGGIGDIGASLVLEILRLNGGGKRDLEEGEGQRLDINVHLLKRLIEVKPELSEDVIDMLKRINEWAPDYITDSLKRLEHKEEVGLQLNRSKSTNNI